MRVAKSLFPRAKIGYYSSPTGPGGFAHENFTLAMEGYHAAAALGVFDRADFLVPSLYFGRNESSPRHAAATFGFSNTTLAATLSIRRSSEKDAKLAQKLGQLQPFIAVFPPECMGQLGSFGPT